jgi:hypothetical protein
MGATLLYTKILKIDNCELRIFYKYKDITFDFYVMND